MFGGVLCHTAALVVVGQVVGVVSDRVGRKKPFVIASTLLYATGLALLTQVSTVHGFYGVEVVLGAAFGTFPGVDLALALSVLPNRGDAAKDLGVFDIASAAPQTFAPLLGSLLLGAAADHYKVLYLTAAAVTVAGALVVSRVRSVR